MVTVSRVLFRKVLLAPILLVQGCGSIPAGGVGDGAAPRAQIDARTNGQGSVIRGLSPDGEMTSWLAFPAEGWRFQHWLWVGTYIQSSGAATEGQRTFRENPLLAGDGTTGTLTAVFVLLTIDDDDDDDDGGDIDLNPVLAASWQVIAGNTQNAMIATAFAIDDRRLATNAHVAEGACPVRS